MDDQSFLDKIFDLAVERLSEGEPLDVEEIVKDRPHLRDQVDEMLRVARRIVIQAPDVYPSVGGYEILEELGHGAMGTVYLARQLALEGRKVALKVLPASATLSARARRRFRIEANALARIRHPNVVSIFEVIEEEGLCAYAMEWIEGRTLAQIIQGLHRIDAPRRSLELATFLGISPDRLVETDWIPFLCRAGLSIARALEEAHGCGLLHRDVKPSNILIRKDGEALLSDFGLVRATDTPLHTQTGEMVGTPAYASPEQLKGEHDRVDARSDVYSLGAALYHGLAFEPPYPGRNPSEILRRIEEGFYKPLGRKDPKIPADLRTIIYKAMDPDPIRRYARASALADDLDRFLNQRPILARPPSSLYRFRKLVSRHRTAFSLLSVLFFLLLGFGATMTVLLTRIAIQAEETRQEAEKSDQFSQILKEIFTSINPSLTKGRDVTVREVFEQAFQQIEHKTAKNPELDAAVRSTIGMTYRTLDLHQEAESLLRQALETHQGLFGEMHLETAKSYDNLGRALYDLGELDESERHIRRSLEILEELFGGEDLHTAQVLIAMGRVLWLRGDVHGARQRFEKSFMIRKRELGEHDIAVAEPLNNLAILAISMSEYETAENLFKQVLHIRKKALGARHALVERTMRRLVSALRQQGKEEEADLYYHEANHIHQRLLNREIPFLLRCMIDLTAVLRAKGDHESAIRLLLEGLEINRKWVEWDSLGAANYMQGLGDLLNQQLEYEGAAKYFRECLELSIKRSGPDNLGVAHTAQQLGDVLYKMRDLNGAEEQFREVLRVRRKLLGVESPITAITIAALSDTLMDQGRYEEAAELLEELVAVQRNQVYGGNLTLAESICRLGAARWRNGEYARAEELLAECTGIRRRTLPEDHWLIAWSESLRGGCLAGLGRIEEAEPILLETSQRILKTLGSEGTYAREALLRVVHLYEASDRPEEAAKYKAMIPDP